MSVASGQQNPILQEYYRRLEGQSTGRGGGGLLNDIDRLPPNSIFDLDERMQKQQAMERGELPEPEMFKDRDRLAMLPGLDPNPGNRIAWERRRVIQSVRRGGRLSKKDYVSRTEREHLIKSPMFKTSVKKLSMLARQISGKRVDDAIFQMGLSKKKVATKVREFLEYARDEATVRLGMGLGLKIPAINEPQVEYPLWIESTSGKRREIKDPSTIYIAQAWVGRGEYGKQLEFRARGRANVLRLPYTSITVFLKEERTLIREAAEREARASRKKPRTQLPNRRIYGQNQYLLW